MSYIAFDLDALNVARDVGAAAGLPEERITHGLLRMWAWCFREKTDAVQAIQVQGFFGAAAAPALVAFGFLAEDANGYRVRGAERYLRVSEARSRGGHAAKSNLIPGGPKRTSSRDASREEVSAPVETQPSHTLGSTSALTPNTEHRTPNTSKEDAASSSVPIAAFEVTPPDIERIEAWTPQEFWRAAECSRRALGYPPQKWPSPKVLSQWWAEARGVADVAVLGQAFERFARTDFARSRAPPAPFELFAKTWSNHLPSGGRP